MPFAFSGLINFISGPDEVVRAYQSSYDPTLVVLSVAISIFAAFVAFELAGRISAQSAVRGRAFWHALGAIALGIGTWAMHFIGMLAFRLDCSVFYDPWVTLLSMLPGIAAAGVALQIIRQREVSRPALLLGGVVMGAGVGIMHYTGMAAMRLNGVLRYDLTLFLLSILVAVVLAVVALSIRFALRRWTDPRRHWLRVTLSALVMGGAISGMHYTAMAAAYFIPGGSGEVVASNPAFLAWGVSAGTLLIIALALVWGRASRMMTATQWRYDAILQATTQGFILLRSDGLVREANPAFLEMLGYPAGRVVGEPLSTFLAEMRERRRLALMLQGGAGGELEVMLVARGGRVPCTLHVSLLPGAEGEEPMRLVMVSRSDRFRTLFHSLESGVVGLDRWGRVEVVNPAAEMLLEQSDVTLVGHEVMARFSAEGGGGDGEEMLAQARRKGSASGEMVLARRRGEGIPVAVSVTAVDPLALETSFVVLFSDITERKRLERDSRRAREEAEHASRAKGEFLATMSHEIRTPMNVVVGMSDLLLETAVSPEQEAYIEKLQHAGNTLLELINNILDLSKIEAGRLEVRSAPFDVGALVREVCGIMTVATENKGVALEVVVDEALPGHVMGDALRFKQVLVNLVGNAIKFTDQGRIRVRLASESRSPARLICSVEDTGSGIGPEHLETIFDEFSQADASITRRYGGSGLGLAISRALVERMGGSIRVESRLGEGSTFHVSLPLQVAGAPPAVAEPSPTVPAVQVRPLEILLAEDSEDNRALIAAYLKGSPHRLTMVTDGVQALERVRAEPFDLILMDIQMPIMDGYSATRAIRDWEREGGRESVPILALTANALEGDRERSLAAGCDEHLTKPIKKRRLLEAIDACCLM